MKDRDECAQSTGFGRFFSPLIVFDLFLLGLGIVFLVESRNVRRGFQQVLDARVYPRVVAAIVVIVLLCHLVQLIVRPKDASSERKGIWKGLPREVVFKLAAVFFLFVGYILVIRRLGYFETGFLFLWGSTTALGERSISWMLKAFAISLGIILATYLIFGVLLNIYVPPGLIVR